MKLISKIAVFAVNLESANAFRIDFADRLFHRIKQAKHDEEVINEGNKSGENDETVHLLQQEVVLAKRAIERELRYALEHLAPKCKDAKKRASCTKEMVKRWRNEHLKDFLTWEEFEGATLRNMPPEGEMTTFELLKQSCQIALLNKPSSNATNSNEKDFLNLIEGGNGLLFSANFAFKAAIAPSLPSLGGGGRDF